MLVEARAAGHTGIGYSYAAGAAAALVSELLAGAVVGGDALSPPAAWARMRRAVRNIGYPGVASSAISAVDVALWDLKARLLGIALSTLLGRVRERVPVYGSGGFTSYSDEQMRASARRLGRAGHRRVKMKVGSEPEPDPQRVRLRSRRDRDGRRTVRGRQRRLHAASRPSRWRRAFVGEAGVSWFEEPVSSDDLEGLRLLRDRAPAGMDIAAGEYGYDLFYFRRMLDAGAVDVLQADVTRCGGITQLLQVGALCAARGHTALGAHQPGDPRARLRGHRAARARRVLPRPRPHRGAAVRRRAAAAGRRTVPGPDAPGLGLTLREDVAERYER